MATVDQAEMMWTKIAERAELVTREREQCFSARRAGGGDNAVVAADRPTADSGSLGGSAGAGVAAAVAAAAATRGPYYLWTDFGKNVRLEENVNERKDQRGWTGRTRHYHDTLVILEYESEVGMRR